MANALFKIKIHQGLRPSLVFAPLHTDESECCLTVRGEDDSDKGVFIIDKGVCSIMNDELGSERKKTFFEIARSNVVGESTHLEIAVSHFIIDLIRQGLDYFGDIVAGSMTQGKRAKGDEPEVVCLYLSEENFLRIPHHELQRAM